ncbi:hypothetical protein LY11_00690 [Pedobacter cryoconitis]|uniref:Uncharacterized protein n=1 Tax=Pedobacter cryoconitis TaxID=188932 RepID=A0A327TC16_9SPHI|nr:hypothetical protein LY11_00690 [Pedobacter cryoconitis]
MARSWYAYNGIGDPIVSASYNLMLDKPNANCVNGCAICAIFATGTGITPTVLSNNIRTYINNLLANQVSQPNGVITIKRYVYGKTGC